MKQSTLSFLDGFTSSNSKLAYDKNKPMMAFDWDKAAKIIRETLQQFPNLIAEAGLQQDWNYTGGIIFEKGFPTNESYTYLCSNWATPTLIIECDGLEILETDCCIIETDRFTSDSKWDNESLLILGIQLP